MSGGPVGVENDVDMAEKFHCYVNIDLHPGVWCNYKGGPEACGLDNLVVERDNICLFCKYRNPIDVPGIIAHKTAQRKGGKCGS